VYPRGASARQCMAQVQHKLLHDLIFGGGYPAFPRMESAFSRTG
jgi:hypothetical protein